MNSRLRMITGIAALFGAGVFGGCSGGGSSGSQGAFAVEDISVPNGAVWQINRRMEFRFSEPVNFASVNLNTINIAQPNGLPAVGEFLMIDAQTVGFQPACPTQGDYSDAGLLPGSVSNPTVYVINIVGSDTGGATVRSISGEPVVQSQTTSFTTPSATSQPGTLFIDTAVGPPAPITRCQDCDNDGEPDCPVPVAASYIELGEDPDNRQYFVRRCSIDAVLGAEPETPGFEAPLNLYSDVATRVAIVLQINQAVDPAVSNVNADTVQLEYQTGPTSWQKVPHTVELVANCTETGSVIRIQPLGVLPQGRVVRAVLAPALTDVVAQSNTVPLAVGAFVIETAGATADEILDEFAVGATSPESLEDTTAALTEPRAVWGGDKLEAAFAFDGTGGQGGSFDWVVSQNMFLDTTFTTITNTPPTTTQTVVNGRVDVRDFVVKEGVVLTIQGPNPCKILASGRVEIGGSVLISGNSNKGVATLNTANQPEPGAGGNCGGGRGGTASYLTTQSTPGGESGYGAFNTANAGGQGGESSFNPNANDHHRRPGGGGGGTLGKDALRPAGTIAAPVNGFTQPNANNCPDQIQIGLDAENGFPGWPTFFNAGPGNPIPPPIASGNNGAQHPGLQPQGGAKGPRPFFDADPNNDFWGTMLTLGGTLIHGELLQPWAGAGGGAGGDAVNSSSFPRNPFDITGDEKGAGGGGGAGSLTILSLGEIKLLKAGRIEARGGTGGGGENSSSVGTIERIGGGSGGGSGGHIVLQSAAEIDLTECRSAGPNFGGIYALGGQGGAGAINLGGSLANGVQTTPNLDALPPNAYVSTTTSTTVPCSMSQFFGGYGTGALANNTVGNTAPNAANAWNGGNPNTVVAAAGGDGGPGIIQLHTPTLASILPPTTTGETMYKCVKPPPIGATPNNVNTPVQWDQMLPIFGRRSMAQSKWIPLGLANIPPGSPLSDAVEFQFAGTDAQGFVEKSGAGATQVVAQLPPMFTELLAAGPPPSGPTTAPYVMADERTIAFPAGLVDPVYTANPALMRRFGLTLLQGVATQSFEVTTPKYEPSRDELQVTVSSSGTPLIAYGAGDTVELRPRFFRASTEGVPDALPETSTIKIEFQATSETPQGTPDLLVGPANGSDWVEDITELNSHANADDFRFVRFRVTFDILAGPGAPVLSFDTPIPALEFLRIPFKF